LHIPVLTKEVLQYLNPAPNKNFIDCTMGGGGHTLAILEKTEPNGKVLGIDQDPEMIKNLKSRPSAKFKKRLILVCDNFINLKKIVRERKFKNIQGILFDLGISSWHLENSKRGFSFQRDEGLDMRYDPQNNILTAEQILNRWRESEIERILKAYGQERFARRISRKIIEARKQNPIKRTSQLVEIIKRVVPPWYRHRKIHCATRTFQALRIAVNDELDNLENTLPQALEVLEKEGRLVVISFHSLEDRIVKNFFKDQAQKDTLMVLTKKPITPTENEIENNPRSRSAKLRAAEKNN